MLRTLQRLHPAGGRVARLMTCSTLSNGNHGLRPRPGLSCNPSSPRSSNRWDHLQTQGRLTLSSRATSDSRNPVPRSKTISARRLSRRGVVLARARRVSSFFSSAVSSKSVIGLAISPSCPRNSVISTYFYYSTLASLDGYSRKTNRQRVTSQIRSRSTTLSATALTSPGKPAFDQ